MKNPNQDFDALIWKPKNRFLRHIMAKYVDYVEVAGYIFAAMLAASIIWAWFVPAKVWVDASGQPLLKPVIEEIRVPSSGQIVSVSAAHGDWVSEQTTLMTFSGENRVVELKAPISGYVYWAGGAATGFETLQAGSTIDSGKIVMQVVNFDTMKIDFQVTGNNADSVSVGDSAKISLINPTDIEGLVVLSINNSTISGNYISPVSNEFRDELAATFLNSDVTTANKGLYTITNVSKTNLVIESSAEKIDSVNLFSSHVAAHAPFFGVVNNGKRIVELEMTMPFPQASNAVLTNWTENTLRKNAYSIDGKGYQVSNSIKSRFRTVTVQAEADLATYKNHKTRREEHKGLKEYNETSFKATGTIIVTDAPMYVKELARMSFGGDRAQFLKTKVLVHTYSLPWGRRMIKK